MQGDPLYTFGQTLSENQHFYDHIVHEIPVQVYLENVHIDIGFVESFDDQSVRVNRIIYERSAYRFVSRPGY